MARIASGVCKRRLGSDSSTSKSEIASKLAGAKVAYPAACLWFVAIDPATRESLEICVSQGGARAGSLLDAVDRTVTGAGNEDRAAKDNGHDASTRIRICLRGSGAGARDDGGAVLDARVHQTVDPLQSMLVADRAAPVLSRSLRQ